MRQLDVESGSGTTSVAIEDLDKDGNFDIATTQPLSSDVEIFFGGPSRREFSSPVKVPLGPKPFSIVSVDLDVDGDIDLVAAGGKHDVWVVVNDSRRSFHLATTLTAGDSPNHVVSADLDGDDIPDLAVANAGDQNPQQGLPDSVSVILNRKDGRFAPAVKYEVGDRATSIAIADFDRDGDLDIAVANEYSQSVTLLENLGKGKFRRAIDLALPGPPQEVVAPDLDADGEVDIAMVESGSGMAGGPLEHREPPTLGGTVRPVEPLIRSLVVQKKSRDVGHCGWMGTEGMNMNGRPTSGVP